MPTLDSLFKKDAKAITSREPGWLKEAREVSGYADRVAEIEALADTMAAKTDEELREIERKQLMMQCDTRMTQQRKSKI